MDVVHCEICEQRPAKLKCEDCNTYCCPKDIDVHKELLPDHPHHLIPLKSRPAHPASLRSQPPQAAAYTEPGVPAKRKAPEEGKAIEKRRPSAPTTLFKAYTVFESRVDIAQTFKLYKWILNQSEAETLVQTLTALKQPIKVIGTYGPADTAMPFIRGVLNVTEKMLPSPEDMKEGILAYLRTDTCVLCFYFNIEKEDTYLRTPYPSSAREAVYLRLLFDLCPTVICCISEEIQRNWYWTTDSQLQNPFVSRIHRGFSRKIDRRKVQSSEIEEIAVVIPDRWKRNCILTSDHFSYLFQTEVAVTHLRKQAQPAIDKFKTWLSGRKPTISGWTTSSDYENDSFEAFSSAMKTLPGESVRVINTVKERYAGMKKEINKSVENYFTDKFRIDFIETFELQNKYTKWIITVTWEEFYAKLRKLYTESHKYGELHTHAQEARCFVLRHKKQPHLSKDEIGQVVNSVFDQMEKTISAYIEDLATNRLRAFEAEITEIITNLASRNTEMCSIRTFSCSFTKDSVEIKDEEVENRFTLKTLRSGMSFHVLNKKAAFAVMNEGSGQTVKFNPSAANTYEVEELKNVKSCVLLASGSTVSLFVAFYNEEQRAIYGTAREMKGIDKGTPLNVYGELVRKVTSACVLQKARRLLLLNEEGTAFVIELASSGRRLTPVMVDRGEERHSKDRMPLQPETLPRPLAPRNGSRFYDIKSSDDETLYFFLTDTAIEIYDLNYVMVKTHRISSPRITYKILANGAYNVILTEEKGVLRAFRFQSETEQVESQVVEAEREEVPGNPIIDILYYAFFKFGLWHPGSERKPCFYLYSHQYNSQRDNYVQSIPLLSQAFDLCGSITTDYPGLDTEDIKWRLLTRAPLHLCSIQNGNLIPLRDGLNNFEAFIGQISESKTDLVTSFLSYIRLGGMEAIIKDAEELKVIAIIGKQSSGKSYLLNRLFGTRFDVAAHRCTDGIWLSVSRIQHQTFLVLDCEGLFSQERFEQEEIKLCLLLAAIADVTILNQDLSFSRNQSFLFEKFTLGIDRLKGEKLFKGRLEIAVRDVAANQDEGANAEVKKFVDTMNKKADVLIKLFGGEYDCCSYHNFENEQLFEEEVVRRRQVYLEIPARWTSGEEFLIILKTVMAQIYADDGTSIDSRTFQLQLEEVSASVKKAIEMPEAAKELLSAFNPTIDIACSFRTDSFAFDLRLFDLVPSLVSTHQVFTAYMEKFVPPEKRRYEHNDWYQAVEGFMKAYFEMYRTALFDYFEKCVAVTEEFRPIYEGERNILEHMFDNVIWLRHTLCRRKCKFCDFCCVKPQNHSDNCDCSTTHKCPYPCSVCGNTEMCSQNAGHPNTVAHVCATKMHTCGRPCGLRGCKGTCTSVPNHGGSHRCSAVSHPCGAKCSAFHMCKRTCEIDQMVEHSQHDCGQQNCPFPCELCRGQCNSSNHFHFLSKDPEDISADTGQVLHFCSKDHPCSFLCEQEGVCDLQSITEQRVWTSEFEPFFYTYVLQQVIRRKCAPHDPMKTIKHAERHWCGREHKCDQTCPDCGAYCEQVFGHEGVHSTAAHRNKEKCIYVAKSEGIEYEIEEESKHTTRKLKAGESARPEFCDQSCVRKGRGHTHPIECPGGRNCLQAAYPGRAVHSKDKYYPDLERVYDLVECGTYWRLKRWEPPVLKKNPAAQSLFARCPLYCASPEHTQPVYCDEPLFHSDSLAYKDHQFSCSHTSALDIVFVLDCTTSMGSSFPQVKDVITQVINRYQGTKLSNTFSIVGYTDHSPDNGYFPGDNPIMVYPASKQLRDFEINAALAFLTSLQVSGGGPSLGEAMLDGMNAANSLFYRDRANRLVFIIGDDCPHGEEFAIGTAHREGCPCGLNWKALLNTMKTHRAEIRFVNLSSITNKTADLFKAEYGEGFEVIPLASMANISTAVVESIVAVIEHNLEFSLG